MRNLPTLAVLCGVALVSAAAAPAFAAINYNASKSNTAGINYNSSKSNTGNKTYNSSHSNTGNAAFKSGSATSTIQPQWGVGRANKGTLKTLQGTVQNLTGSSFTLACANGQHYTVALAPKGKVVQKNDKNAISLNFTKLHNSDSVSVTGFVNGNAISASSVMDSASPALLIKHASSSQAAIQNTR